MTTEGQHEVVLVRHGETEWSRDGRHTGRTEVPLSEQGREDAGRLRAALGSRSFALVLTSPLARAAETCRLAGYGDVANAREELMEWDYGEYEGRTTREIRGELPGWTVWTRDVPGGESVHEVGRRVDRVLGEVRDTEGDVAIFGHGHLIRVLAARWIGLPPEAGSLLALDTASVSVLGYERETPVIKGWNQRAG